MKPTSIQGKYILANARLHQIIPAGSAFVLSQRALSHPLSLAAIALLLVNDHWLKSHYPSYLTGKISDAAGLFFFPFVVIAGLSLFFSRYLRPRRIAHLAFTLTLIFFSLLKLSPGFNQGVTAGVSFLLGYEPIFVLDHTDLAALIVLWPSWRLWTSIEKSSRANYSKKLGYLALLSAALASMATSPCLPIPVVDRLIIFDDLIYARLDYGWPDEPLNQRVAVSMNGGRSWDKANAAPTDILNSLEAPLATPITSCSDIQTQLCYQISEPGKVERSEDGGNSWSTAWQVPWGRSYFMDRFIGASLLSCKQKIDLGPYDLTIFESPEGPTVIVALGNEGVLVGEVDGTWRRVSVESAGPTPYSANSIENVFLILWAETAIFLLAGILSFLGVILYGAHTLPEPDIPASGVGLKVSWALRPLYGMLGYILIALGLTALDVIAPTSLPPWLEDLLQVLYLYVFSWSLILIPFLGLFFTFRRFKRYAPGPVGASRIFKTSFLTFAGVFPLAWLPFPTWTFGLLPAYPLAIALSLLLLLVAWRWGLKKIRGAPPTPKPAEIKGESNAT